MKEYKITEDLKVNLTNIIAKAIHPSVQHDVVNAVLSQLVNAEELKEPEPDKATKLKKVA